MIPRDRIFKAEDRVLLARGPYTFRRQDRILSAVRTVYLQPAPYILRGTQIKTSVRLNFLYLKVPRNDYRDDYHMRSSHH